MKFAKKMKLVECDDVASDIHQTIQKPSNTEFLDPKTLFNLDLEMNKILSKNGYTDSEKWTLYNQALMRYLQISKQTRPAIENTKNTYREDFADFANSTYHSTSENPLYKTRDSLESIKSSKVRDFFVKARENMINEYEQPEHQDLENDNNQYEQDQQLHRLQQLQQQQQICEQNQHNQQPYDICTPSSSPLLLRSGRKRNITPPVRSTGKKNRNQGLRMISPTQSFQKRSVTIPLHRWEELSEEDMCFSD